MIQATDSRLIAGALPGAHASLNPTVYRPTRPSITHVASGEEIETEIFRGPALARAGIALRDPIREGSEIVAIRVPALHADDLVEIRIPRAYTDRAPARPGRAGRTSHGRPANSVLLPHGWLLIASSVPTVVCRAGDGRTRIEFDAPDEDASELVLTVQRA